MWGLGKGEQYSELRIRQFFKARFGCIALLCLKQSKTKTRTKIKQFGCVSNSGFVCSFVCFYLWGVALWKPRESSFPIMPYPAGRMGWGEKDRGRKTTEDIWKVGHMVGGCLGIGSQKEMLKNGLWHSSLATPPAFLCQRPRHFFPKHSGAKKSIVAEALRRSAQVPNGVQIL